MTRRSVLVVWCFFCIFVSLCRIPLDIIAILLYNNSSSLGYVQRGVFHVKPLLSPCFVSYRSGGRPVLAVVLGVECGLFGPSVLRVRPVFGPVSLAGGGVGAGSLSSARPVALPLSRVIRFSWGSPFGA